MQNEFKLEVMEVCLGASVLYNSVWREHFPLWFPRLLLEEQAVQVVRTLTPVYFGLP